jgi:hypothetical protein
MSRQPLPHLWIPVGRVIVDDCVAHFSRRDLRLDRIEEADELLVPVALHVAADDGDPRLQACPTVVDAITTITQARCKSVARVPPRFECDIEPAKSTNVGAYLILRDRSIGSDPVARLRH